MMKAIVWIIGLLLVVVLGVGAYLFLNSGSLLKTAIEEFGPDYLGVPVTVNSVDLSVADGSAAINGLAIAQPAGFETELGPHAMKLGSAKVAIDTAASSADLVVLKQVVVSGTELFAVARGKKLNFQMLMESLDDGEDGAASDSSGAEESETKYIIEQLDFVDAKASLDSDLLGQLSLPIPDLHLKDIGRNSDGATAAEVAKQVMTPITKTITEQAVKQGLDVEGVKKKVEDKIREKLGSGLKNLLNR